MQDPLSFDISSVKAEGFDLRVVYSLVSLLFKNKKCNITCLTADKDLFTKLNLKLCHPPPVTYILIKPQNFKSC